MRRLVSSRDNVPHLCGVPLHPLKVYVRAQPEHGAKRLKVLEEKFSKQRSSWAHFQQEF